MWGSQWKSSEWREFGAPDLYKGQIDPRGGQAKSPGLDGHPEIGDYVTATAGSNVNKSEGGSHFAPQLKAPYLNQVSCQ